MDRPIVDAAPRHRGGIADRVRDWRYERWIHRVLRQSLTPPPPSAFAMFGDRSVIVPPARVDSPHCISIGNGVVIHEGSWLSVVRSHKDIEPRFIVGDRSRMGRFCHVACTGEIVIGEDVLISDKVLICDSYHAYEDTQLRAPKQPMTRPRSVHIGAGALIAIGAIILPGVRIGEGAYVSDWAVVSRSVPPRTIVGGNPARIRDRVEVGPRERLPVP